MQEGGREGGRGRRRRREGNGDADIARRKVGAGLLHRPSVWHHQPPVESWRHREPDRAAMTKMTKIGGGKKTAGISWDLPSEQNQEIKNYAYNKLQNYLDRQSAHTRPERKAPSHSWRASFSSLFLFAADLLLSPLIDSKWNLPTSFKRNNANEKKKPRMCCQDQENVVAHRIVLIMTSHQEPNTAIISMIHSGNAELHLSWLSCFVSDEQASLCVSMQITLFYSRGKPERFKGPACKFNSI